MQPDHPRSRGDSGASTPDPGATAIHNELSAEPRAHQVSAPENPGRAERGIPGCDRKMRTDPDKL